MTLPGNGAAGRIPTCIVPFRRRMPHVFDHGSNSSWSEWQDFHLRPPGPKPGALKTELHSERIGGLEGSCTLNPPADNGALCELSYESEMACRAEALSRKSEGWWEALVTLQFVTSDFVF